MECLFLTCSGLDLPAKVHLAPYHNIGDMKVGMLAFRHYSWSPSVIWQDVPVLIQPQSLTAMHALVGIESNMLAQGPMAMCCVTV